MLTNNSRPKQRVKRWLQRGRLEYLARIDLARFGRTAAFSVFDASLDQVTSRIMYNVHALEKGLARNHDLRLGFGRKALSDLNDALVTYRSQGYDLDLYPYFQGVSVIRRYVELHEKGDFDTSFLSEIVDPAFLETSADCSGAGTKEIRAADKVDNDQKSFYAIAQGRSSVREFSGGPIDTTRVRNAVANARRTPSVCNRQGWRVYWVEDKELAASVLKHQRGFGYGQMPEVLLTIAVSNSTFLSPVERNQAFVDGGLFSMSVLYGLEHEGLAAVPLNAMMYARDQRAVRDLLQIDDSDMIVMFIAVGAFPAETTVPISDRKPLDWLVQYR